MGGLMRGGYMNINGNNSSRGRSYGVIVLMVLVVAFGGALLIGGMMFLQRIKERRIFNLLIRDKDTHLTSLQLLLQKEKDQTKEAKWKLADMRAKIYAIRSQKRQLDNKIMEMQSTISSLREEQRLIELALEEKQNQIKVLKDKQTEINNEAPPITLLSEIITQKESEIEDLKHQLQSFKVPSMTADNDSTDASTNPRTRMTERVETRDELHKSTSDNEGEGSEMHPFGSRNQSASHHIGEQARDHDDKRVKGGYNAEPFGEKSEKPEITQHSGVEHEKDAVVKKDDDNYNRVLRHGDEENSEENKAFKTTTGSDSSDQTSTAQGDEKQVGLNNGSGNKLEMQRIKDNRRSATKTITNGKTFMYRNWKNKGIYESNGVVMRNESSLGTAFPIIEEKQQTSDSEEAHGSDDHSMKTTQQVGGSNQIVNQETGMQNHETPVDVAGNEKQNNIAGSEKQNNTETNQHRLRGNGLPSPEISGEGEDRNEYAKNKSTSLQLDQREILNDMNKSTELIKDISQESMEARSNVQNEGETQNQESWEAGSDMQNKDMQNQANGIQELAEKIDDNKDDTMSEQIKEGEIDEESTDPETEDLQEAESKRETSKESANESDGDDEEYRDF